jgi:hypothetical protein
LTLLFLWKSPVPGGEPSFAVAMALKADKLRTGDGPSSVDLKDGFAVGGKIDFSLRIRDVDAV